jgi:chemotaxis protein CheX
MAASKSWDEEKNTFTFTKVSDALARTMQLIGVNYDHLLAKESSK